MIAECTPQIFHEDCPNTQYKRHWMKHNQLSKCPIEIQLYAPTTTPRPRHTYLSKVAPVHALAYDHYEKPIDRVKTNRILWALVEQKMQPSCIRTLVECYPKCSTKIELFHQPVITPIGKVLEKAPQFKVVYRCTAMDNETSLDWDGNGIHTDGKFLSNRHFADEIVILSRGTYEPQTLISDPNEAGRKWHFV